jgi:hypothetical protein
MHEFQCRWRHKGLGGGAAWTWEAAPLRPESWLIGMPGRFAFVEKLRGRAGAQSKIRERRWEVENAKRTAAIGFQMNGLDSICTFEHHPDLSIRYAAFK